MADELRIERFSGPQVQRHIAELARLRIAVFRAFPYLYDGSLSYEEAYLRTYTESPESFIVVVFDGGQVVGASTAIPMAQETEEIRAPFLAHGYDPERIFYFGESVLLQQYRGRGLGVRFFQEREARAREIGRFDYTAFCAVERPPDHPHRPPDYLPLDGFWMRRGYLKHPELRTTLVWREIGEAAESPKPMVFWMKDLRARTAG